MFKNINWKFVFSAIALITLGLVFAWFSWIPFMRNWAAFGGDWWDIFRPAITNILSGESPYTVDGFFSPPWVLLIMLPFTLLTPPLDMVAIIAVSLGVFVLILRKLGASWLVITLFLITPNLWWGMIYGNVDFLVALGFILPPQIGLLFVLAKPQIGAAIALFWIVEAWRKGNMREVVKVSAPFFVTVLLSFVFFGWWLSSMSLATTRYWNIANFPYLLPIGAVMLFKAVQLRKQGLAITSGIFLSPYIGVQSIPIALFGLLPSEKETIIAIISLWFVWFVRGTT